MKKSWRKKVDKHIAAQYSWIKSCKKYTSGATRQALKKELRKEV